MANPQTAMVIAVLFNLKPAAEDQTVLEEDEPPDSYTEWDDLETILAVQNALRSEGEVVLIEANEDCFDRLRRIRPDIVFNIAEGRRGLSRESHVPSMLEFLGIPYTGSSPITLSLCLDKARCKEFLLYHGIATPKFVLVDDESSLDQATQLPFTLMVKPVMEGSSKGITNDCLVWNIDDCRSQATKLLRLYRQPVLIEEFLPGSEFTVGLIGNYPNVEVLPIVEIRFDGLPPGANPIYSYEAKWVWDRAEAPVGILDCPAKIPLDLARQIADTAVLAFRALGCRDWCRIDMRLDAKGQPHVLEVNPLPGVLPDPNQHSCLPQAARAAGMTYDQLIQAVFHAALNRYGIARTQPGALQKDDSPWKDGVSA